MKAVWLLSLSMLGACAASPEPAAPSPAQVIEGTALLRERKVEVAAGKFVELNLEVPASTIVAAVPVDPIEVAFEASGPLTWNIHTHDAGEVQLLAEGTQPEGRVQHTPSRPGPISVLFENRSQAPVTATLRIERLPAGTTGEWYPAP